MAKHITPSTFLATSEGQAFREKLQAMLHDEAYSTTASYSPLAEANGDHSISFVDKHIAYLCAHPTATPEQYLSNLRLKTRIR